MSGEKFRVINACLSGNDESRAEYEAVMQDILVNKTGRFKIVTEPHKSIDPQTGYVWVILEVIEKDVDDAAPQY